MIENEKDRVKQNNEIEIIKKMIQASCIKYSDVIRSIFLRNLIDNFFEQTQFCKFNTKKTILSDRNNNDNDFDSNNDNYVSLYEQNLRLNKNLPSTKLSTKVPLVENFHRSSNKLSEKQDKLAIYNLEIMEIVDIICVGGGVKIKSTKIINTKQNYNPDLINNLAQLILEKFNLSYIDNHWPDVENFRLYIERDVKIQSIVEESPVCWMLLNFVAQNQQAFLKCLPIIKSLLACLILQWENVKEQSTKNIPKLLESTIRYLNLLNKAQMLRDPLNQTIDIVSIVNSYETHIILTIIWNYLKYNFNKSDTQKNYDPQIFDQMKIIFQRNLNKLATHYVKFFKHHIN